MKKNQYDEKQQFDRGRAFQYSAICFLLWLIVWECICEITGLFAEPLTELLVLMAPPFAVCLIACVVKDAYDPIGSRPGMVLFALMPAMSLFVLVMMIVRGEPVIADNTVTTEGGLAAIHAAWITTSAVYWIKYIRDTRAENAGLSEEE